MIAPFETLAEIADVEGVPALSASHFALIAGDIREFRPTSADHVVPLFAVACVASALAVMIENETAQALTAEARLRFAEGVQAIIKDQGACIAVAPSLVELVWHPTLTQ